MKRKGVWKGGGARGEKSRTGMLEQDIVPTKAKRSEFSDADKKKK